MPPVAGAAPRAPCARITPSIRAQSTRRAAAAARFSANPGRSRMLGGVGSGGGSASTASARRVPRPRRARTTSTSRRISLLADEHCLPDDFFGGPSSSAACSSPSRCSSLRRSPCLPDPPPAPPGFGLGFGAGAGPVVVGAVVVFAVVVFVGGGSVVVVAVVVSTGSSPGEAQGGASSWSERADRHRRRGHAAAADSTAAPSAVPPPARTRPPGRAARAARVPPPTCCRPGGRAAACASATAGRQPGGALLAGGERLRDPAGSRSLRAGGGVARMRRLERHLGVLLAQRGLDDGSVGRAQGELEVEEVTLRRRALDRRLEPRAAERAHLRLRAGSLDVVVVGKRSIAA